MSPEALAVLREFRTSPVPSGGDSQAELSARLAARVVELEAEVERLRNRLRLIGEQNLRHGGVVAALCEVEEEQRLRGEEEG